MGRRSDKIKNRKDSQTRARTKIFARIGKMIMVAAKSGGSDLMTNKALADALDIARAASFPKETMEKAIARATSTDQADFKESSFEVYGHGGAVRLSGCMVTFMPWKGLFPRSPPPSQTERASSSYNALTLRTLICINHAICENSC
jgi:osmotically-inducible protein OsmY